MNTSNRKDLIISIIIGLAALVATGMFISTLFAGQGAAPEEMAETVTPVLDSGEEAESDPPTPPPPEAQPLTEDTPPGEPSTAYQAQWLRQSVDASTSGLDFVHIPPGDKKVVEVVFENVGTAVWQPGEVILVYRPPSMGEPPVGGVARAGLCVPPLSSSATSPWADEATWLAEGDYLEVATIAAPIPPGQPATFQFTLFANPKYVGWFTSCDEYFGLAYKQSDGTLSPEDDHLWLDGPDGPALTRWHLLGSPLAAGHEAKLVAMRSPSHDRDFYDYAARQYNVLPGEQLQIEAIFENVGETPWALSPDGLHFTIFKAPESGRSGPTAGWDTLTEIKTSQADYCGMETAGYGKSYFYDSSWLDHCRGGQLSEVSENVDPLDNIIQPGERGLISLTLRIPAEAIPGRYVENLVLTSGAGWILNRSNGGYFGSAPLAHLPLKLSILTADTFIYPVGDDLEDHTGYEIVDVPAGGVDCHFGEKCSGSRDNKTSDHPIHVGEDWIRVEEPRYGYCEAIADPYPTRGPYQQHCEGEGCYCGGSLTSDQAPVRAVANGAIVRVGYNKTQEYYTILIHHTLSNGENFYSFYVHVDKPNWLSAETRFPWRGDYPVRVGERISRIVSQGHIPPGSKSGLESHLHFAILNEKGYQFYNRISQWIGYIDGSLGLPFWEMPCEFIANHNHRLSLSPQCQAFEGAG